MLFVFFFLLIMGLVIYGNVSEARLGRLQSELGEQRAIDLAQKLLVIPELACTNNAVKTRDCVEISKLDDFKHRVDSYSRYYLEEFGPSKVTVELVSPLNPTSPLSNSELLSNYEVSLFDFSAGLENKQVFHFPVSLWDRSFVPPRTYFGMMVIEVYS